MSQPPHICTCGKTVAHGVLCECQKTARRARNARHDSVRPSARARGYNSEWRKARLEYLSTHPHCQMAACGKPSALVDHIIPHKGDQRLFWNRTNWQALCTPCHSRVKQRIERNL